MPAAAANANQVRDLTIREMTRITAHGTEQDTVATFYVGNHGPFTLTYGPGLFNQGQLVQDVQAKVRDLNAIAAGLGV